MDKTRLKIEGLKIGFQQGAQVVPAVDEVSLELRKGEMLALLGESGSGKSLTALSLLGLLPRPSGRLMGGHAWFDGKDLYALPEKELQKILLKPPNGTAKPRNRGMLRHSSNSVFAMTSAMV